LLKLCKTITGSYTLLSADNDYTIIVNNGATNITITVPTLLVSKFNAGFIQQGSGLVLLHLVLRLEHQLV
jgi:hypothetical protein